MTNRLRIGVVGCGIAGCSFALLARRNGHEVDLFEQTPRVGPQGAGVLLQPGGQRVLSRMGLLDAVTARAEIVREIHAITHRGRELIRLQYADGSPGATAFGLHRGDLFSTLHGALDSAAVRLHLGAEIHSCERSGGTATLRDKNAAYGPFDLIVAADGARSRLRQCLGLRHSCSEYEYGALWAVGTCSAVRNKLFQVTRGTRRLCGLLPMGQERCSFFWGLRRDEHEALRDASAWDNWRREVLALSPLSEEILQTLRPPEGLLFTAFWHVTMPSISSGMAVFIGDAGHATSPHLGQGVNLALIDAATLTDAIESEANLPAALARYEAQRVRQLRYYSRVTRLITPFFQANGWIKGCGRDVALPWMTRVGPMRRLMLRTLRTEMYGNP